AVKSGYAISTGSTEDLLCLYKSADTLSASIGNCTIENQATWVTYRLDNIRIQYEQSEKSA
ncbi:hypothetical protein BJ878DRAFT_415409, partial [Calycina marina]